MNSQILFQSKTGGRSENQDFFRSAKNQFGDLIIVCDGMGGHNGGRHAAELAVQTIIDEVANSKSDSPIYSLQTAIEKANTLIWEESNSNPRLKGMGTTVVALLITDEKAICCHAGDSRLYQIRNGKVVHRTFDHSHVFELVRHGILTEEQARLSEKSNIITQALGISPTVEIELTDNLAYQKGDLFLLCSDGIWGLVPESQLVEMISQKSNIESVLNHLVETIDSIGFESGGKHDNLTAALIEIISNPIFQIEKTKQISKNRKPLKTNKLLIYIILLVFVILFVLNFYFSKREKQVNPKPKTEMKTDLYSSKDTLIQTDTLKKKPIINENN